MGSFGFYYSSRIHFRTNYLKSLDTLITQSRFKIYQLKQSSMTVALGIYSRYIYLYFFGWTQRMGDQMRSFGYIKTHLHLYVLYSSFVKASSLFSMNLVIMKLIIDNK